MQIGLTSYDELNLRIKLWTNNKYDHFLKKGDEFVEFPKARLAWEKGKDASIETLVYGGGASGGKSHTIATFLVMESLAIPGLHSFVARKELKQIRDSTLITFIDVKTIYDIPEDAYDYNGKLERIIFKNGSVIHFLETAHQPKDPNYNRYGSRMFTYGWLEEAQETPYKAYTILKTRIGRQFHLYQKLGYTINKLFVTLNPEKNWVYNLYYLPWKDGTLQEDKIFIRVLAHENPFNTAKYLKILDDIEDPITRARLRDGEWEYEEVANALFTYDTIIAMFEKESSVKSNSYYISCDPARKGKDEAIIFVWKGYTVIEAHIAGKCETTDIEDRIAQIQKKYNIPNESVVIDSNGLGGGVNDHIPGSFEYIGHTLPIVKFKGNRSERSNKENESVFKSLRDQVLWTASNLCLNGVPAFAKDLIIEKFGKYTEYYDRTRLRDELKKELEVIAKTSKDSDKKIKVTYKYEIMNTIGRSTNLSDCWAMRFVYDAEGSIRKDKQFTVGVVPHNKTEENEIYERLMA